MRHNDMCFAIEQKIFVSFMCFDHALLCQIVDVTEVDEPVHIVNPIKLLRQISPQRSASNLDTIHFAFVYMIDRVGKVTAIVVVIAIDSKHMIRVLTNEFTASKLILADIASADIKHIVLRLKVPRARVVHMQV